MRWGTNQIKFDVVEPAAEEPVSLEEFKQHANVYHDRQDATLSRYLQAAREQVEIDTCRALVDQTIEVRIDWFDRYTLYLPIADAKSVVGVWYTISGVEREYTLFQFSPGRPGRIRPAYGTFFPWTFGELDSIRVQYVAGYGDASDVPAGLKSAICLLASHYNIHREAVDSGSFSEVPLGYERLIRNYSWRGIGGVA